MSVAIVQEKRLRALQRRKEKVEEKEMKSVLISIQPKWCELIANGKKTLEVRKSRPKIETPFKCYIYQTKSKQVEHCDGCDITYYGCGKVIGEFVCDNIEMVNASCSDYGIDLFYYDCKTKGCLNEIDVEKHFNIPNDKDLRVMKGNGYAWHISKLKIYDKPKELGEFRKCDIYCGDCKHIVLPTDRLSLSDCDRRCDKFNKDLLFYDSFNRCEECLELNTITRPPQSWCYVEE